MSLKENSNALKEGDEAPSFTALSDSGEMVRLEQFKGKNVVLYFYPKDMTPGCTTEACDFQKSLRKFEKANTVVLGVSKDSVERHQNFKRKYRLQFPLLADVEGELCEKYGVWKEKSLYGRKFMGIVRSTFIIDESGKIKKVFPNVKVKNHVPEVLSAITGKPARKAT